MINRRSFFAGMGLPVGAAIGLARTVDASVAAGTTEGLAKLDTMISIQGTYLNWDQDEYMRGMYNGLVLAKGCLTGTVCDYRSEPLPERTESIG